MPVLETQHLSHVFPDGTTALEDISLRFAPGEFVLIVGANGSGKTVFVRHLNGLLSPTQGRVLLDGKPISSNILRARKTVGMIFQDADSQIVGQTVAEDVAFGLENLNMPRPQIDDAVRQALETVGLAACAGQNPHTLSGGQKRRLAIAGVLVMDPGIIIFDEPFTGLDFPGVIQILRQMVLLNQAGHTIILVTHELEKALAHADRLIIFAQGRLMEDGQPEDVVWRAETYGVRIPLKAGEEMSAVTWLP